MRTIIILTVSFSIMGCLETATTGAGLNPSLVSDSWEYVNPNGQCGSTELFGDTNAYAYNCVHYIQVTRFADGSAYFTLNLGPASYPYDYTWSEFLPAGTTIYSKTIDFGTEGSYQMTGNMASATPSIFLNYTQSSSFTNSEAAAFTLSEVTLTN